MLPALIGLLMACNSADPAANGGGAGGGSGTSTSTGGSGAGAGGGSGGSGGSGGGERPVLPCASLGPVGEWEHITPAEVELDPAFETPAGENYGVHSFVIDPRNTATLYLGTSAQGIYKTTDCGASWTKVNTGENADAIDGGRQWTFVIDSHDSNVMYTNTGYGALNAWKSSNGGVDWQLLVDPAYAKGLQFGGFVQYIRMDPTDPKHLLVTPHFECEVGQGPGGLPSSAGCMVETRDGGDSWRFLENTPPSGEGGSQWMLDDKLWFWSAYFDGMWRTANGGESWQPVIAPGTYSTSHGVRVGGTYYTGGVFTTLQSQDGITWTPLPDAPGTEFLTTDGTKLFGSRNGYYAFAPLDDLSSWTELPAPAFPRPDHVVTWGLEYDPDHHILYSQNSSNGLWRLVLE